MPKIVFGTPEANAIVEAEPELLHCPFCGGKPKYVKSQSGRDDLVYCPDCQTYPESGRRQDVIRHWNTRWEG